MKTIYLCGPIAGCEYDECTDWRKYVAGKLNSDIVALSPMRGKEYLKDSKIKDTYNEWPMSTAEAITCRDRFDVMNCDMLFVNLLGAKKVTIGSMIELGWADAFRKPIILVMEEGNVHQHGIVDKICGFKVKNLNDGIDIANAVLSLNFARISQ